MATAGNYRKMGSLSRPVAVRCIRPYDRGYMTTNLTRVLTAQMHGLTAFAGEYDENLSGGFFKKLKKVNKKSLKFTKKIHAPHKLLKKKKKSRGVSGFFDADESDEYFDLNGYGEEIDYGMGDYANDDYELFEEVYDDQLGKSIFKKLKKVHKKVTTKVKKIVKSPAFKKLVVIGGIVAGSMFLGPAAAVLIKKGAMMLGKAALSKKMQKQASAEAPAVTQEMINLLNNPAVIQGIQNGSIPAPPTEIGSPAFVDWATSIAMTGIPSTVQSGLTAGERSQVEAEMRTQMYAQQSAATQQARQYPAGEPYSPMPEVPGEVQEEMKASMLGDPKKLALIAGAAVVGLMLFGRRRRR